MVSKKVLKLLHEQVVLEGESSAIYLAMAAWAEYKGFRGTSGFMYKQSEEERSHMNKIMRFIMEIGEQVKVPGIREPKDSYKDLEEVFTQTVGHEQKVTASIHNLYKTANENGDFAVASFLKWFIDEQVEEEASAKQALDIVKMASKVSFYLADKEIGALKAGK